MPRKAKPVTDIRSLARVHTTMALNTLVGIARQPDAPPAARVAASEALLNRGWGKPSQPISDDPDNPIAQRLAVINIVQLPGPGPLLIENGRSPQTE